MTSRTSANPLIIILLAALLGGAAGAGGYVGWQVWSEREPDLRPEFSLEDLDGNMRSITEWDGKVVVLNFWGSWCPPCVHEIPMFMALQDEYGEQGLQFVGVALDRLEDARAFYEELEVNYPSMVGVHEPTVIGEKYGNERGTLPYTVIIDRDGRIVERFDREVTREQIEPKIREYL